MHLFRDSLLATVAALAGCDGHSSPNPADLVDPEITQHASSEAAIFANAYLVESEAGVVLVDATLTVSEATAVRARLDATGKPLLAILLTHGHPDHYNGTAIVADGESIPIVASASVDEVIRRDDEAKAELWTPVFGDEWPTPRTFPSHLVHDGDSVSYGGMQFTLHEVGPGESHFDSYWVLQDSPAAVFAGDLVFSGTHAYMTDGHSTRWLDVLDDLQAELPPDARVFAGHGPPAGLELVATQKAYLEYYRSTLTSLLAKHGAVNDAVRSELTAAMNAYLGNERLAFLVGLGADAVAAELSGEDG